MEMIIDSPDAIGVFGGRLQSLFDKQVTMRADIEKRWLEDLRQYNGKYDQDVESRLAGRSNAFINITRPKCNKSEARLGDMLFPTDDRNWAIQPTPVPELVDQQHDKSAITMDDGQPVTVNGKPVPVADAVADVLAQAKSRAEQMQREMDDQLRECNYNGVGRDVIHDAVVLGTGILKGPVVVGSTRKSWRKITDAGVTAHVLEIVDSLTPVAERVGVWDFYPEMQARRIEDAEFVFQRHYLTKRALRALKKRPGFIAEQIDRIITDDEKPRSTPDHIAQLRELSGIPAWGTDNRYELIEYHGPVTADELLACGIECEQDEIEGIVWLCGGVVVKAAINPLDTQERPYSVFCWEIDDTCIFGIGVPRMSRNQQAVINASWRMAMDNAGLAAGPQIVVNERIIRPLDGNWTLTPRKVWALNSPEAKVNDAIAAININSHFAELLSIIKEARSMVDDETSAATNEQGDAGAAPRTNLGISMYMNTHNVVMRRAVKCWDDDITIPFIGRLYDWNMQYNENEEVKGDCRIDARGSSSLLVREMQAQNLMQLAKLAFTPALASMTKIPELYRKIVQSMHIEADEIVLTNDEIERIQQQQSEQPQQMSPELQMQMQKLQMEQQENQRKYELDAKRLDVEIQKTQTEAENNALDARTTAAQIQRDVERMTLERETSLRNEQLELAKMANARQMTIDALQAQVGMKKLDIDSKHQLFNAEAAIKVSQGSGI